jgi:hypothetical protein
MRLIAALFLVLLLAPAVLPATSPKPVAGAQHKSHKVKRHKGQKHKFGKAA